MLREGKCKTTLLSLFNCEIAKLRNRWNANRRRIKGEHASACSIANRQSHAMDRINVKTIPEVQIDKNLADLLYILPLA